MCTVCNRFYIRKDCLIRHVKSQHKDRAAELLKQIGPITMFISSELMMSRVDLSQTSFEVLPPGSEQPQQTSREPMVLSDEKLEEAIRELLTLLVDDSTLQEFGWPESPLEDVLESVIVRCGHEPASREAKEGEKELSLHDRMRENSKVLFSTVIDDESVKTLLSTQSLDEVILYVLELAKS